MKDMHRLMLKVPALGFNAGETMPRSFWAIHFTEHTLNQPAFFEKERMIEVKELKLQAYGKPVMVSDEQHEAVMSALNGETFTISQFVDAWHELWAINYTYMGKKAELAEVIATRLPEVQIGFEPEDSHFFNSQPDQDHEPSSIKTDD